MKTEWACRENGPNTAEMKAGAGAVEELMSYITSITTEMSGPWQKRGCWLRTRSEGAIIRDGRKHASAIHHSRCPATKQDNRTYTIINAHGLARGTWGKCVLGLPSDQCPGHEREQGGQACTRTSKHMFLTLRLKKMNGSQAAAALGCE